MTVKEVFESMDYGPAPESAAEALAWLVDMGDRFGCFIDGAFTEPGETFESRNPATGNVLAHVTQASQADIDRAVAAARAAQPAWAQDGHARARVLYALARQLQKQARLFAVLETLDNGKPIRESRDIDIPLAARHFYHHAGYAQLMETELSGHNSMGVCGQIVPWNFPLLMLSWKIAPALAAGNTVVLKPAEYTSLTALLFADICRQAGVPPGVVNIVTGDGQVGERLVAADVDKIAFTGSTAVGRRIREATAGTGKALTLELGGKSPYIVFDDADLDSAVEGLVDAIWFNQRVRSAAPALACWCTKPSRTGSMTSCARGWTNCGSAIRWTRASISARSWTPSSCARSPKWSTQTPRARHTAPQRPCRPRAASIHPR